VALLEVAASSAASAFAAQAGGAGRVELCASLDEGGVTPSHGTILRAREGLTIPLYVLIRPRAGDFVYEAAELAAALADIAHCRSLGCDGVVVGALTPDGEVDRDACARFIAARGMGVTFHRAFDLVADKPATLEALIDLGFERVLTSGGMPSAVAGAPLLSRLVAQAGGRMTVMPGAGIAPDNVAALREVTRAHEFHASAKRRLPSAMRRNPLAEALGMGAGETRTDVDIVRALVAAIA